MTRGMRGARKVDGGVKGCGEAKYSFVESRERGRFAGLEDMVVADMVVVVGGHGREEVWRLQGVVRGGTPMRW